MEKREYYKKMFLIGGIWNLVATLPLWFLSLAGLAKFPSFGMPTPPSLFFFHAMIWFIVAFGIGYFLVSRDISKNHGVVLIGAFSKGAFVIDTIVTVATLEAGPIMLVFAIGDLIFAVLFVEFLLWTGKLPKA